MSSPGPQHDTQKAMPLAQAAPLTVPVAPRPRLALRALLPLPFGLAILWVLAGRLSALDWAAVGAQILATAPLAWAGAALLTAISFWGVARYDLVARDVLGLRAPDAVVTRSGAATTALAQTLGVGLITGSLVRWRLLRRHGLGPRQAVLFTATVTASFTLGWLVVTGLALALAPALPTSAPRWLGGVQVGVILALAAFLALCLRRRPIRLWGRSFTPPAPALFLRITWLAAIDTLAAAGALWLLLPAEVGLSYWALLPAFLVALGCGIYSGTPMGLGAFELTLLLVLPMVPEAALVGAILAYRLVYFVVPAGLAALYVLWPGTRPTAPPALRHPVDPLANLVHGGEVAPIVKRDASWSGLRLMGLTLTLGDPTPTTTPLPRASRRCGTAHYKITPRLAAHLRTRGWLCLPVATEAMIDPRRFTLASSRHRQLRRKLRHAEAAGLSITAPQGALPLAEMTKVAQEWAQAHGGERGFSVGRFDPQLLAHQRVFLAWQGDKLLGFVSFHIGRRGWLLDLVRHRADIPDGTMHSLIHAGLSAAARENVGALSLDAVPFFFPAGTGGLFATRLAPLAFARAPGARGLYQFKQSFAPRWRKRYLAAPGPLTLVTAGLALAWLTTRRHAPLDVPPKAEAAHDLDEDYAFAS